MHLDFQSHASHLALGAATENLVLEAHRLGFEVETTKFPLPDDPHLVAVFAFHDREANQVSSDPIEPHVCDTLVESVPVRLTNRQLGRRTRIAPSKLGALVEAARSLPGADLLLVETDEALAELGEIIAASDRLRILHPKGHDDFVHEMRWTSEEAQRTADGIDLATIDLTGAEQAGLQLARPWPVVEQLAQWGGGAGFEKLSRKWVAAASALGLIRFRGVDPQTLFLDAGRAVQRVWLEATRQDIAFQPLSGVLFLFERMAAQQKSRGDDENALPPRCVAELAQLRERFEQVIPAGPDQRDVFLFRLAEAEQPAVRSLRRGLEEILFFS